MEDILVPMMVFAVPIVAILAGSYSSKLKHERKIIQDQITLEQLKHENYMIETEKMRLELEQQRLLLDTNRQARLESQADNKTI